METYNKDAGTPAKQPHTSPFNWGNQSGRIVAGLLIVAVGVLLLAKKADVYIPGWVLSFEMLLIAVGVYLGFRHSFKGIAWLIPVLIGGFLLIDDFYHYDIKEFTWPVILIGVGLFILFRGEKKNRDWGKWDARQDYTHNFADDYLDSTVVFGGIKKNIISKNFRGGEAVTVFGGTEINLMQADINGAVVMEVTQIFGGTKLIVPSNWKVQSKDLVAILGGVDDKRAMLQNPAAEETGKILILKGTCLLGGIEIRSY